MSGYDQSENDELTTGEYAIPSELMDLQANAALSEVAAMDAAIDAEAVMRSSLIRGRLAFAQGKIRDAKTFFLDAANMGSEEGKFYVGWLNVNHLMKVRATQMRKVDFDLMKNNFRFMAAAIVSYQKPEMVFKMFESLQIAVGHGLIESYNADDELMSWGRMIDVMNYCASSLDEEIQFNWLYSYLSRFIATREFMDMERSWRDK